MLKTQIETFSRLTLYIFAMSAEKGSRRVLVDIQMTLWLNVKMCGENSNLYSVIYKSVFLCFQSMIQD